MKLLGVPLETYTECGSQMPGALPGFLLISKGRMEVSAFQRPRSAASVKRCWPPPALERGCLGSQGEAGGPASIASCGRPSHRKITF